MIQPKSSLEREAWEINNPALSSYLLWLATVDGFKKSHGPIHPSKLFCIFPFLYYADTRVSLAKTRSGLQSYLSKFSSSQVCKSDIPLSIHNRITMQKAKTLDALILAFDSGILILDSETGLITPNLQVKPISQSSSNDSIKELEKCAKKLGGWFSVLSNRDLARVLKVVF
ncbi:hypothetical protein H5183_10510 [Pseudoalteromonas sp. SR44-8]|nr:hypothetical protein [Pseudoalteromonas sp. SR44-8]